MTLRAGTAGTRTSTTAEALVRALADQGVDCVFGIPGTHNLSLYAALGATAIRHVLVRHEQAAAFAADGYARASGKPGVCLVTTGPGVLNTAAAAATAYADSIPILIISPGLPDSINGGDTGNLHETKDQSGAMNCLVAWSSRVGSAADADATVRRAFQEFRHGRPRPIHLEVPLDVMDSPGEVAGSEDVGGAPELVGPIDEAATILAGAVQPVLIVGGGAVESAAAAAQLAQRLGCAVMTTVNGKGVVSEGHPLSLGSCMRLETSRAYLSSCDVVLAVGTELAESDLWGPPLHKSGLVIRVDIDPQQLHKNLVNDIGILGDAAHALDALVAALPHRHDSSSRSVEDVRSRIRAEAMLEGERWAPLIRAIREALDGDAILCADNTQAAYYGAVHFFDAPAPRRLQYATGYATLGHALPAAIGAKIAAPAQQVAVLIGDGGIMFTLSELATAVEQGLALPIVVVNSGGYSVIRRMMEDRQMPPFAVDFVPPRFGDIARSFGCGFARPHDVESLRTAVSDTFDGDRPVIIEWEA